MSSQPDALVVSAEPEGLWLSVSDVARLKQVEKSSISRRVVRLEANGFSGVRAGPGGKKLVNLAAYDKATGELTDEVREANGSHRGLSAAAPRRGSGLAAEQTRKTAYQAEMARLDLEERQGKLLPIENVREACVACAENIVKALDRIPLRADEIAATVVREGAPGVRVLLKAIVFEVRERLAKDLIAFAERPEPSDIAEWPKSPERLKSMEAEARARLGGLTGEEA